MGRKRCRTGVCWPRVWGGGRYRPLEVFDRVHDQRLLSGLGQNVADSRILKLISRMLKAKVLLPQGTQVCTDEGTPLSPLLSNVVLDEFAKELAMRGLHFVCYADGCNIFVRNEQAGQRVMGSIRKFLQSRV